MKKKKEIAGFLNTRYIICKRLLLIKCSFEMFQTVLPYTGDEGRTTLTCPLKATRVYGTDEKGHLCYKIHI